MKSEFMLIELAVCLIMLEPKCLKLHGALKQKGKLKLSTTAGVKTLSHKPNWGGSKNN
jgi:hypothetical protein